MCKEFLNRDLDTHISSDAFVDQLAWEETIEACTFIDDRVGGGERVHRQIEDILEIAFYLDAHITFEEHIIAGYCMEGAGEIQFVIAQACIICIRDIIALEIDVERLRLTMQPRTECQ